MIERRQEERRDREVLLGHTFHINTVTARFCCFLKVTNFKTNENYEIFSFNFNPIFWIVLQEFCFVFVTPVVGLHKSSNFRLILDIDIHDYVGLFFLTTLHGKQVLYLWPILYINTLYKSF